MTTVFCRTRFIAFHYWPNAPKPYEYLGVAHRHEFHVEAAVEVTKTADYNREVEFQDLKKRIDYYLAHEYKDAWKPEGAVPLSCEMFAERIADVIESNGWKPAFVTVSEDGENGATFSL